MENLSRVGVKSNLHRTEAGKDFFPAKPGHTLFALQCDFGKVNQTKESFTLQDSLGKMISLTQFGTLW